MKNRYGHYVIDIRNNRLRGGRVSVTSRTRSRPEFRRRYAAVATLLDQGEYELVERLRKRDDPLRIEDVERAVRAGTLDLIRNRLNVEPLTVGAAIRKFQTTVKATRAVGTVRQYDIVLSMFEDRFESARPLSSIGYDEIEQWLHEAKETTGGMPWSQNRQVLAAALVGRLYNVTIRREAELAERAGVEPRITRNPLQNVEMPAFRATRSEFLRPQEWRQLSQKVEGTPKAAFLAVGCLAGLRISEAAHLRTEIDIVLEGERPRIEIQPRKGEYEWGPKTKRSVRTIPLRLFPSLLAILGEHVRYGYAAERYFFRIPGKDRPISRQVLARWTKEAFEAAGIRYGREMDALTYHSLRHTFISWLVQEDYSLKKIEKLSGTSVDMINEVYGHLVDEDLDRAMALMERKVTHG